MSSDGHASLPIFDKDFNLLGLEVGKESSLLTSFQQAVKQYNVPIEHALMSITSNPADILGLNKGRLKTASDADIVLLDKETLTPEYVWANGTLMVQNSHAVIKLSLIHI